MRPPALLIAAVLLLAGLAGCEKPPPKEVMDLLPIPADAVLADAGCVGNPREQGFTCVVHARSAQTMENGSSEAERRMRAWKEYSWDWVPGRIQWSWQRGSEDVSVAIHDMDGKSQWSLTYIWGDYPEVAPPDPDAGRAADPSAKIPASLASMPLPPGAKLLHSMTGPGPVHAEATFAVPGEPQAILAPYRALDGWTKTLEARAPWALSVGWTKEKLGFVATVWTGMGGAERKLTIRMHPAG